MGGKKLFKIPLWTHPELIYNNIMNFIWQVVLGLHIVRGDNIAVIGEIDEEIDKRLDLKNVRAEPITSIVH